MIKYETSVYVTVADILIGLYHILLAPSFHLDITYSSLCTASISLHCASLSGNLKAAQVKPGIVVAVNTPGASLKQWRDWNRWINSPTSHPLEGQFWNTFCLFPWWVPCGSGSSTYCRNQLSNTLYWLSFLPGSLSSFPYCVSWDHLHYLTALKSTLLGELKLRPKKIWICKFLILNFSLFLLSVCKEWQNYKEE